MSWSLSASGHFDNPSDVTNFKDDLVGLFKKYAEGVRSVWASHQDGSVTTTEDVTTSSVAAEFPLAAPPEPTNPNAEAPAPSGPTVEVSAEVPPEPTNPNAEVPAPSGPVVDVSAHPSSYASDPTSLEELVSVLKSKGVL